MSDVSAWSQTAAGNGVAAPPDGAPEGMQRSEVNDTQREDMAATRRWYEDPEWVDLLKEDDGFTVTRTNDTTINVVFDGSPARDASSKFPDGSRIRLDDGTTQLVGFVTSTSFATPNTSVVVDIDGATVVQTSVNKAETHVTKSDMGRAAWSPIGTTLAQDPPQLVSIDDMSSAAVITEINNGTGLDADTLGDETLANILVEADKPGYSLLTNSDFSVWQRGTLIDLVSTFPNDNGAYVIDQWALLMGSLAVKPGAGSGVVDLMQEPTDTPPDVAPWACKFIGNVNVDSPNAEKFGIIQFLTRDQCQHLRGQSVSAGVWVKMTAGSAMDTLQIGIIEWSGTADSIGSIDAIANWSVQGTVPSLTASFSMQSSQPAGGITVTTEWQHLKLENITLASGMSNVGVFIWLDDTGWVNDDELFVGGVGFNRGARLRDYHSRPRALELRMSQRHFQSTFDDDEQPVQNLGNADGCAMGNRIVPWRFDGAMFSDPTVVTYNPLAANALIRNITTPGDEAIATTRISKRGVSWDTVQNDATLAVHATAEAVL